MKKRLLSALLALALVFVLLPTTALADTTPVTDENVKINGTAVIVGNDISLGEGNGTYSYDKATHTLTLNSATINATDSNIGISFGVPVKGNIDYKIELVGNNSITSTSAQAIYVEHDISVEAWENDTMKRSTLTINGSAGSSLILNASGYEKEAIWSKGDFTLSGGTAVTAFSSGKIAVNVGSMTINNSKLSAQSSSYGTTVVLYGLKMIGDTAEFEALNTSSVVSAVLGTSGASENTDWSNYQFTIGSYSGGVLTKSDPEVCSRETLNKYLGLSQKEKSQYIHIAKRTIPALQRTSDVLIAGKNAVVGVETSIPSANGSGTYFYDQASKTLTLNNVNITSVTNAIQLMADGTYTINLVGTNTISDASNGIFVLDDSSITSLSVTITGVGSLDISAKGLAIGMKKGDLKFENTGAIKLATGNIGLNNNALSVKGNITITDMSKYSVTGTQQTGGKPLGSEVSLTEASQLKGGTTGYRIITITPAALEKSNVYVAGTNLYKNTAYTIQNGKPVMGGTYPGNYNIYFDATDYVLHVKDANIDARGTTGIYGTSDIVFVGVNSITASTYGIYSYFKSSDLKISGTGSLNVKTIAGDPAIATAYDTSRSIIISGNGFTVTADTSETTSYAIKSDNDLTITDGAAVIAKSNATRAIDITGNLTVNSGATLTATSASDSVPTVQVGGNASFTGSTVTITNNSTALHKDAAGSTKGDSVSSALYVKGNINTDNANVTAKVENGGGNAIGALGNITVKGSSNVTAVNKGQKFTTIIAKNVYVSGDSKITANNLNENPVYNGSYLAFPAIEGKIVNQNTDYSLKFEGQHNGTSEPTTLAPGEQATLSYYNVTITRGDKVVRTPSPVVIDGHTLQNDTYYTITNGSTVVANGSESNYNAIYDSANKTLKLNNAKISTTTKNAAIKISEDLTITVTGTNELKGNYNHCIESYDNFTINGTGTLNMTNTNSSSSAASVIYCGPYKNLTIAAEVIIKNEAQPGNLIFTVEENACSFAGGYNVYASTNVSGSPLETYDAAKSSTYKYLRITKENLAPTTPTPQTPFTIYGIPAQFVDGGMIATTGVTATSSNNINLPIDRVEWYTFTPGFRPDGSMDSVINKTKATGNFEAGKYYVVEIRFVQDLSPFESWDMKVSGWSDNDVSRQSVTARNDIEIYFLTPASAATHEHNWAENYDTVYHWKMCTYDGCTAIKDKALHVWNAWHTSNNEQQHSKSCSECSYSTPPHDIDLAYVSDGEQGHHLYCKHDGCTFVTGTTAHVYAEGSNICTDCGYNKSAPCDHGNRAYTNNGDGTHKVTCKACGATIVEKQSHEFGPTGACIYCGATQSGGDPTPDNPGTIVIIRPAEEEKPAQQPNPSTGANDLVGLAVAAAVAAALGSAALLRKHD